MMKKRSVRLNSKGFTLVELLVVIAILALLAGIGVPQVMRTLQRSRIVADLTALDTVQSAVDAYRAETGAYWWQCTETEAADGTGITTTEPTAVNAVEIDLTAAKRSLITNNIITFGSLLDGNKFPVLKSVGVDATTQGTGAGHWFVHKDGHVFFSATKSASAETTIGP